MALVHADNTLNSCEINLNVTMRSSLDFYLNNVLSILATFSKGKPAQIDGKVVFKDEQEGWREALNDTRIDSQSGETIIVIIGYYEVPIYNNLSVDENIELVDYLNQQKIYTTQDGKKYNLSKANFGAAPKLFRTNIQLNNTPEFNNTTVPSKN